MRSIHVNPRSRTVRVDGGATWQDVNHELQPFGLAAAGGYVGTTGVGGLTLGTTGVGGLTLGGGLGWMVRKHGLATLKPFLADATYINYIGDEGEEGIQTSYGAKLGRLAALKANYDPSNFFHVNQNIKPRAGNATVSP
jgi:FAD/FMN-containing dehydrogenase